VRFNNGGSGAHTIVVLSELVELVATLATCSQSESERQRTAQNGTARVAVGTRPPSESVWENVKQAEGGDVDTKGALLVGALLSPVFESN
jgi:hypothetical protein